MYLALVLKSVTEVCFLDLQLMAAPPSMKTKPKVDFLSFMSLAQSASTYLSNSVPLGAPHWNMRSRSQVPLMCRSHGSMR